MSYHQEKNKVTLKVVPHTEANIFTFKLSKKIIKGTVIFSGICLLALIGTLYYYYYNYNLSEDEVNTLKHYRRSNQELKKEKSFYEEKINELTTEIENINDEFGNLINQNEEIRNKISYSGKIDLNSNIDFDSSKSIGYYDFESSKNPSKDKIKYIEANLEFLKEIVPKQKNDLDKLNKKADEYNRLLAAKPKGWPIQGGGGDITSPFGNRYHPVLKENIFHDGLDIGIWYNNKVMATGRGKVVFAGVNGGYGRCVIIDHGYGYRTLYAHNNRVLVRVGQWVTRGDIVALTGNSGRSTGPHLHYEIQYRGKPVDPMKYIK